MARHDLSVELQFGRQAPIWWSRKNINWWIIRRILLWRS